VLHDPQVRDQIEEHFKDEFYKYRTAAFISDRDIVIGKRWVALQPADKQPVLAELCRLLHTVYNN